MNSPQLDGLQINMSPYGMPSDCTGRHNEGQKQGCSPSCCMAKQKTYLRPCSCAALGVCVPFKFTLPNRTLWTWCGWSTTQRTDYLISASGSISAQLMKSPALNVSTAAACTRQPMMAVTSHLHPAA